MERFIKLNNLFFDKFQKEQLFLGLMVDLMYLAKHKDNTGVVLNTLKELSEETGISLRSLKTKIKALIKCGEIEYVKIQDKQYIHIKNYSSYIESLKSANIAPKPEDRVQILHQESANIAPDSLYIYNTNVYNKNDNKNVLLQKEKEKEKVFSGSDAKLVDNINTESLTKEKEKPAKEKETSMENSNFYEKENSKENPKKRYCDELAGEQNSENTTSGYTDSGVYQTNTHRLAPEDVKYKPTPEEINYREYVRSTINSYVPSNQFAEFVSDFNDIDGRQILRWVKEFFESETKCNKDHLLDIKGDGSLFQRKLIKHLNNYVKVCYKKYKKSIAGHNVI